MGGFRAERSGKTKPGRRAGAKLALLAVAAAGLTIWLEARDPADEAAMPASCAGVDGAMAGQQGDCRAVDGVAPPASYTVATSLGTGTTVAGLIRPNAGYSQNPASEDVGFSDLAASTYRPQSLRRARFMTVAERCALGLADPGLRCGPGQGAAGSLTSVRRADQTDVYEISGRVITADGFGIPGVTLIASRIGLSGGDGESDSSIVRSEHYVRYRAVSGPDGSYSFSEIPDGDYSIRSNRHDDYASRRITVRAGVEYADLVLESERRFSVEGVVTDEHGIPLSHVSVAPVVPGAPSVRTDRSGRYRLPVSLAPDASTITLRFESAGFTEGLRTAALPRNSSDAGSDYGTPVEIDAVLQSIELTTNVHGTVTTADGKPLAGRTVELSAIGEQRRYRAVTDRSGDYEFPYINAPLYYRLSVAGAPGYADYQSDVRVTRFDYEFDVVMESYEFGTLRGRIVDPEGAPIPGFELALRNMASSRPNGLIESDNSGSFAFREAPAGELVLASQSMPDFFVSGLSVEPGGESRYEIVLDQGHHELSGQVVDRYGRAIPASRVLLQWTHEAGGIRSSATRRTATDAQGHFEFHELGPGPHSIVVDAPGFATTTLEHDLRRDGYSVTVRMK